MFEMLSGDLLNSLLAAGALGVACAALSVIVVTRHWAFLSEGIAHAGFGGAGTAWLAAVFVPGLNQPWVPYTAVIGFCLLTAVGIAALHRHSGLHSDTTIGIFLVASLAWGFVGQQAYVSRYHAIPPGFENLLWGQMRYLSFNYTLATVLLSGMVVGVLALLSKEILAYCLEPTLAAVSGVPAGFIHYLLVLLMTVAIVLGVRIAGSVLVAALLVLPGATALLLSARLRSVMILSASFGLVAALAGPLLHARWDFIPQGPAIILVLVLFFVMALMWSRLRRHRTV